MGFRSRRWPIGTTLIHVLRLMTRAVRRSVQSAVVLSWTVGHLCRSPDSNWDWTDFESVASAVGLERRTRPSLWLLRVMTRRGARFVRSTVRKSHGGGCRVFVGCVRVHLFSPASSRLVLDRPFATGHSMSRPGGRLCVWSSRCSSRDLTGHLRVTDQQQSRPPEWLDGLDLETLISGT